VIGYSIEIRQGATANAASCGGRPALRRVAAAVNEARDILVSYPPVVKFVMLRH
jgi:hypothetical protein